MLPDPICLSSFHRKVLFVDAVPMTVKRLHQAETKEIEKSSTKPRALQAALYLQIKLALLLYIPATFRQVSELKLVVKSAFLWSKIYGKLSCWTNCTPYIKFYLLNSYFLGMRKHIVQFKININIILRFNINNMKKYLIKLKNIFFQFWRILFADTFWT